MPNAAETGFDSVHDTQQVYRRLLDTLSRPGTTASIAAAAEKLIFSEPLHNSIAAAALTLLDNEVTFHMALPGAEALENWIRQSTFSRSVNPGEADYIFASGSETQSWASKLKIGLPEFPETGATVLLTVDNCMASEEESTVYLLQGPGIRGEAMIRIGGLDPAWMHIRELLNEEFPRGIDIWLLDKNGNLIGIPRTTRIKEAN
ncbi:phosphonate C-P lyase system protein PhnH [Paenibacillus sp. GP183]|uniref:phosphonate C-P lyase system protein PhnH n=1 Tax=Paenibacillus sp. GP183 TaxID=1882751 RepID=UPI00089C40AB|nr:phosphonate C-P lyase system protein PhnH [Paenibacillus sp. GP183]SEC62229.1 alpha-D-ribose 1-methylphosphonate 5-triphosphate synthase subunit PhnH [Paenibacillus sp. GP183]